MSSWQRCSEYAVPRSSPLGWDAERQRQFYVQGMICAWALVRYKALPFISPFLLLYLHTKESASIVDLAFVKSVDKAAYEILALWPQSASADVAHLFPAPGPAVPPASAAIASFQEHMSTLGLDVRAVYSYLVSILTYRNVQAAQLTGRSQGQHEHCTTALFSTVLLGVNINVTKALPEWEALYKGFSHDLMPGFGGVNHACFLCYAFPALSLKHRADASGKARKPQASARYAVLADAHGRRHRTGPRHGQFCNVERPRLSRTRKSVQGPSPSIP